MAGVHAWQEACMAGGVHGRGACVAGGGGVHGGGAMHGTGRHGAWQEGERGHEWHWAYMARGAYMAGTCMTGGMCGKEGPYVAEGDLHRRGVCMTGGIHVHPPADTTRYG